MWARPGADTGTARVSARVPGLHGVHAPHQDGPAAEKDPGAAGQDDQGGEVQPARVPQGGEGHTAMRDLRGHDTAAMGVTARRAPSAMGSAADITWRCWGGLCQQQREQWQHWVSLL